MDHQRQISETVMNETHAYDQSYRQEYKLGSGGFGTVFAGTKKIDGTTVAIKFVKKSKIADWVCDENGRKIPQEIEMLRLVKDLPGAILMLNWFELSDYFAIIMDRCESTQDLFDYITERSCLNESLARLFFRQIISIVQDLHAINVIHRDLKSENILINLITLKLKLIDFGSATYFKNGLYHAFRGTTEFSPPEYIRDKCYEGVPATVWSIGIVLFDMVNGNIPFKSREEILRAKIPYRYALSASCKHLINSLLSYDPAERPSYSVILNHPWVNEK